MGTHGGIYKNKHVTEVEHNSTQALAHHSESQSESELSEQKYTHQGLE